MSRIYKVATAIVKMPREKSRKALRTPADGTHKIEGILSPDTLARAFKIRKFEHVRRLLHYDYRTMQVYTIRAKLLVKPFYWLYKDIIRINENIHYEISKHDI